MLAIYAGVTSDAALEAMLAILAQRFNCVSSALFFVDARRRDATITLAHGVLAQATVRRLYLNEFAALDPAPAEMARLSLGDAASTDDLFRGDDLVKHTRFLEGFYYRVGLGGALGGPLANSKGRVGMVAVQRGRDRPPFSQKEIEDFRALMPHIVQAVELRSAFFELESHATQVEDGLGALRAGVMTFRPDGVLKHANAAARAILDRGDGLSLDRHGRLRASDSDLDCRLRESLSAPNGTAPSVLMAGRITDGGVAYLIRTVPSSGSRRPGRPLGSVAILSDARRPAEDPVPLLRQAYRLSNAGARLVAALMNGDSLSAYAKRSGTSTHTAKYHLKAAFQKTGTRRQADLVRLCLLLTRDL